MLPFRKREATIPPCCHLGIRRLTYLHAVIQEKGVYAMLYPVANGTGLP